MKAEKKTMKVRELLAEYREISVWTPATNRTYQYCVDMLCSEFEDGDPSLEEITVPWLAAYRARCLSRLSPVTFNSRRRHLSVLWKHAVSRKYLEENVFRLVRAAPVPRKPKAIPRDVLSRYIETLSTAKRTLRNGTEVDMFPPQFFWLAVVKTFYTTGMRLRQLIGLKWKDIDWVNRSIRLRAETSKTRREWDVPISAMLLPSLEDLRRRTRAVIGTDLAERQVFCLPLFSSRPFKHDEMTSERVIKFFDRFDKKQDERSVRMTAHKIRHTTATELLCKNKQDIKIVQELLGHTSMHTTLQYVHPTVNDMRSAVDML